MVAAVLLASVGVAHASKEPWEEYEKLVKSAQEVSPHGPTLFGDDIGLQNGALSFRVTDVALRGNSALPVEITRTFATKTISGFSRGSAGPENNVRDAPMGDWEIDLPHIGGVFPISTGWINANPGVPSQRCSVANTAQASSPSATVGSTHFSGYEIWQGTRINLP